jgi:sugar phosphate isomerase/epimerase
MSWFRGEVPAEVRRNVELWVGCIAGAWEEAEYIRRLARAGFTGIEVEPPRVYNLEDARAFLTAEGIDVDTIAPLVGGKFMSAFIARAETVTYEARDTRPLHG